MTETLDAWPAGSTWVFQGTVAEDGTGGTHICTLTVTPGAGNELRLDGGSIIVGNTATAQIVDIIVTDGTNELYSFLRASNTTATAKYEIPALAAPAGAALVLNPLYSPDYIVSGTMQLILRVSTAAISVTQTFAVVCRLKTGQKPTAVLADTVGTPTLTTNTNQVF